MRSIPHGVREIEKGLYTKTDKIKMIDEDIQAIDDQIELLRLYKRKLVAKKALL